MKLGYGEDAADTAFRRLGDARIGVVVDAQGDRDVAFDGQSSDLAIVQRHPLEVMADLRGHLGQPEDHPRHHHCHDAWPVAVEMA